MKPEEIEQRKFYRRGDNRYDLVHYVWSIEGANVSLIRMNDMRWRSIKLTTFAKSVSVEIPRDEPVKPYAHVLTVGECSVWHTYKQSFPMQFWYSLHAHELFAEGSDEQFLFDVRALPERYTSGLVIEDNFLGRLSPLDVSRRERTAHVAAIGRALADGFDIGANQAEQNERAFRAETQRRDLARQSLSEDIPF